MNYVKVYVDKLIATVILSRPEVHNAFNDKMIDELKRTFIDLETNNDVRIVILTGEGKSFCAGADLNWMKSMVNYSEEENQKDSENLSSLFETINKFSKPIIGKINGSALGGGVGLVSVCDFVIAAEDAFFGFTEVRLGIIPAVISPFVIEKIGQSQARAWFLSGERFDAHQGQRMNLVHEVSTYGELDQTTHETALRFLKAGPLASIAAKRLIRNVSQLSDIEEMRTYTISEIAKLRVSAEGQDGMKAILEKRKPKWLE